MTRIDERVNEVCPCGHRGGRHADLGDGFCHDCGCPAFGAGEIDVTVVAEALARVEQADERVHDAEGVHREAQKALARLLGRPDEGKDFDFEAEQRAKSIIVAYALRPFTTTVEGEST